MKKKMLMSMLILSLVFCNYAKPARAIELDFRTIVIGFTIGYFGASFFDQQFKGPQCDCTVTGYSFQKEKNYFENKNWEKELEFKKIELELKYGQKIISNKDDTKHNYYSYSKLP